MPYKIRVFELIPFAITIAACTSTTTVNVPADTPVAQTAADVAVATNWDAALVWAAAEPVPVGLFTLDVTAVAMPEAVPGSNAASAVASAANQAFSPSGCVTASASNNVATFNLNNCIGPEGLAAATGTFTATFTPSPQGLQIQVAGNNVAVDSGKINVATQGNLTLGSDMVTKTFQANTTSSGTGPYGNSLARSGSYTATWQTGSTCATIASSFTESGSASTTKMSSYVRCRGQCPQSGTTTRTFTNGSVTITYNGSSNPPWTASDGETGTVNVHCP
jgi:hypothetical protein